MATMQKVQTALVISVTLIGGVLSLVKLGPDVVHGYRTHSWPTVSATVVESRWLTHHATGDAYNQQQMGKGYTHTPEIKYTYQVSGAAFTSLRYRHGNATQTSVPVVQEIVARYPVGQTVLVYYDPENPADSVIEPGAGAKTWLGFGGGLGLLFVASSLVVAQVRRSRAEAAS
jgi:Protein of unknown function (DUF3592)